LEGDTVELAGILVGVAVVRAAEVAGVSRVRAAQLHAAVAAHVEEDVDLPVLVAGDDEAVVDDPAKHVVAGPGDLRLVSQKDPGLREDLLYLQLEDIGVVVHLREELAFFLEGSLGLLQDIVDTLFPGRLF
jgi:hypothetical protein